ncbi:hypothetical protein FFA01_06130 [Frigoribacterium faeni]|uniref:Uncharacterized protein n=2 Tax=Frigoribacterium faeni TaxID=145483 RepID=A0ABQ0ULD6_9MICO|nr:hypothetical protein GCM10025699_50960 [Microbacterium flavescens]GEK82304.1 hypothetical protein FFA01_06130 [Frigoribacterium faeni]
MTSANAPKKPWRIMFRMYGWLGDSVTAAFFVGLAAFMLSAVALAWPSNTIIPGIVLVAVALAGAIFLVAVRVEAWRAHEEREAIHKALALLLDQGRANRSRLFPQSLELRDAAQDVANDLAPDRY